MSLKKAESTSSIRDSSIDIAAGLMILVMIINHTLQRTGYHNVILEQFLMLFSFFMPWFFFKGGMFYRQEDVKTTFHKGCKKLLQPYFVYNIIGVIVTFIVVVGTGENDIVGYLVQSINEWIRYGAPFGNLPLWFLFSFFVVRLLTSLYSTYRISPLVVAVITFAGCWTANIMGGGKFVLDY